MKRLFHTMVVVGLMLIATPVFAQSDQPLWEVHFSLARACSSPLGSWLMQKILDEEPDAASNIENLVEAIGFDPRTGVREVALFGNSFEPNDVTLIANLGNTTGNLEGWVLAAPGYRVKDLDAETLLHSFVVETAERRGPNDAVFGEAISISGKAISKEKSRSRMWCALPKTGNGGHYVLVASFDQHEVVGLAEAIRGGASPMSTMQGDSILSVAIRDLSSAPLEIDEATPGAGILQVVQSFVFDLASSSDELTATAHLSAASPARARQVYQLINGLTAMLQLATNEGDEGAALLTNLLDPLTVNYREGDTNIEASLVAKHSEVLKLLDQ